MMFSNKFLDDSGEAGHIDDYRNNNISYITVEPYFNQIVTTHIQVSDQY